MWAKGSPGATSPPKVRNTGRTGSLTRLSVMTISRMGCAPAETGSHTPSASSMRRGPAAMAKARSSRLPLEASAGSHNVTLNMPDKRGLQRQRQRQAGDAAPSDEDVDRRCGVGG